MSWPRYFKAWPILPRGVGTLLCARGGGLFSDPGPLASGLLFLRRYLYKGLLVPGLDSVLRSPDIHKTFLGCEKILRAGAARPGQV